MREFMQVLAAVCSLIVAIVVVIVAMFCILETSACSNLRALTGAETNFSISLGCMVKYRGEWVSREVMTNHKQDVTLNGGAR